MQSKEVCFHTDADWLFRSSSGSRHSESWRVITETRDVCMSTGVVGERVSELVGRVGERKKRRRWGGCATMYPINPFTATACKISGLKSLQTRLQTVYLMDL